MATTIIEASRDECEKKVAETIARLLNKFVEERGKAVLGICGGRSVSAIFNHLREQAVPWKHVHIMMVDERCVTLNSLESNYRLAQETLINPLVASKKLPADNAHPFVYDETHAIKAILKYQSTLDALEGFDVILTSSGEDGHIAALYPKHNSIRKENTGFFLMTDAPKPPAKKMTASRKLLLKARAGIVVFFGKEKEKAWTLFNDPTKTIIDCPAKLITHLPENYVFHTKETS